MEVLFYGKARIVAAGSLLTFEKGGRVQRLAHQLKYGDRGDVGSFFGAMMGEHMLHSGRFSEIDAVVPVPLHPKRLKKRGYNQAACISEGICEYTGWKLLPNGLLRVQASETQTMKQRYDRFSNVEGIFKLTDPAQFAGKRVLLVDDVITTGSTLIACAEAFRGVPHHGIYVAAMAAAAH